MILSLLVLRAREPWSLASFYEVLGLEFATERHGRGPEHLSCSVNGSTLEIYPATESGGTTNTRIGFTVPDLDAAFSGVMSRQAQCLKEPCETPWGRRAVIRDPEGHVVELVQQSFEAAAA